MSLNVKGSRQPRKTIQKLVILSTDALSKLCQTNEKFIRAMEPRRTLLSSNAVHYARVDVLKIIVSIPHQSVRQICPLKFFLLRAAQNRIYDQ